MFPWTRSIFTGRARLLAAYAWFVATGGTTPVTATSDSVRYSADQLEGATSKGGGCKRFKGNVVFRFQSSGLVLKADEACKYENPNHIEARGNVSVTDGTGNCLQAELLTYYPPKNLAVATQNVVCQTENMALHAHELRYDFTKKKGTFTKGVRLVQGEMVLTSQTGTYDGSQQSVSFSGQVLLVDPAYRLSCETLHYDTEAEKASFQGVTEIQTTDGCLRTQTGGTYLRPTKKLTFDRGTFETKELLLAATQLEFFDDQRFEARGAVSLEAKQSHARIVGTSATYARNPQKIELVGEPLLTKELNGGQLYLRADAFVALETPQPEGPPVQEIRAVGNVRLYEASVQGVADGATYHAGNNTVALQDSPIVWCAGYQITGEDVRLTLDPKEDCMHMQVGRNLFMASADPVGNYNQIKSDKMVAAFKRGLLEKMCVEGKSESIYFVLDDRKELVGMNRIKCTKMEMDVHENQLKKITFHPKPVGLFLPAEALTLEQMHLESFVWHGEKWPTKEGIVGPTPSPNPTQPPIS